MLSKTRFLLLVLILLLAGVVGVGKKKLAKVLIPAHRPEDDPCKDVPVAGTPSAVPADATGSSLRSTNLPKTIGKHHGGRPRRSHPHLTPRRENDGNRDAVRAFRARSAASQVRRRPQLTQDAFSQHFALLSCN